MGFVRTFDDFRPPSRADGVAFTKAVIEEGAAEAGPFSVIDEIVLLPADSDPQHPATRDLTTTHAAVDPVAWYRVSWKDAGGNIYVSDPVAFSSAVASGGLISADDVAGVLGISPTPAAPWAQSSIEAAESWARKFLRRPGLGLGTSTIESFTDVRSDGFVATQGPVSAVSVVMSPTATPEVLPATAWTYDGEGVRLRPSPSTWWLDEEDGVAIETEPARYVRVDVTVDTSAPLDPMIRQGVAVAAAAVLTRSPRLAKGLQSEHIGDYSYTLNRTEAGDQWFEQAKGLLRPYRVVGSLVP